MPANDEINKMNAIETKFQILTEKIETLETQLAEEKQKRLELESKLKASMSESGKNKKRSATLEELNDASTDGDAARLPFVDRLNVRVLSKSSFANNNDFYLFYFNLKDAMSSIGFSDDFVKFENKELEKLNGPGSKILANYFTVHLIPKLDAHFKAAIMKRDGDSFDFLNGYTMLKKLWEYVVGPFSEEFAPAITLRRIRFGDNVDNVAVIKETVKFIRLAEKLYDCEEQTNDRTVLETLAFNVSKPIQAEITRIYKDKKNKNLEKKKNFASNFKHLDDLYEAFDLWSKENKETNHNVSNLFPGINLAIINNVKKTNNHGKREGDDSGAGGPKDQNHPNQKEKEKQKKKVRVNTISIQTPPIDPKDIEARQSTYYD